MSNGILLGVTIIIATIIAFIAYKKHWKIVDWF